MVKENKSLIGKKYCPIDNSYILVLSASYYNQESIFTQLAGSIFHYPVECTIVSEPYKQKVVGLFDNYKEEIFINVEYNNHIYI